MKTNWRTRTLGSPRQIGNKFVLGPSAQKLRQRLPKMKASRLPRSPRRLGTKESQDYAKYVLGSLHGYGNTVEITKPAHTVRLKLIAVNTKDIDFSQRHPRDLDNRKQYFVDAINRGETIPPILIHRLPNGKYIVLDGHARLAAYRELGITTIPAIENGLGQVLKTIGKGIKSAAVAVAGAAKKAAPYVKQAIGAVGKGLAKVPSVVEKAAIAGARTAGRISAVPEEIEEAYREGQVYRPWEEKEEHPRPIKEYVEGKPEEEGMPPPIGSPPPFSTPSPLAEPQEKWKKRGTEEISFPKDYVVKCNGKKRVIVEIE